MPLSAEDRERHSAQINRLLDAATPNPALRYEQRQYGGTLGAHFRALDTAKRAEMKANNIPDADITAAIASQQQEERQRIHQAYLNGVENAPAQAVDERATSTVTEVANLAGFGDGWMGRIAGWVARIPVVGELVLAGLQVAGSLAGALLGKIGLGEPGARMVGFGEALAGIRNRRDYANGVNAISPIIGSNNAAALLAELQAGEQAPSRALTPVKVASGGGDIPVQGTNADSFRAMLAGVTATVNGAPDPRLEAIRRAAAGLSSQGNYMLVMLPENAGYAIATGPLNAEGTQLTPEQLLTVGEDKKLKRQENTLTPTALPGMIPSLEHQVSRARPVVSTLADTPQAARNNVLGQASTPPQGITAQAVNNLYTALANPLTAGNPAQPVDTANMTQVMAVMDGSPVMLTGTFDSRKNQFTPRFITRAAGEKADTQPLVGAQPLSLRPDYAAAKPVGQPQAGVSALLDAIKDSQDPAVVTLRAALDEKYKADNNMLLQARSNENTSIRSVVLKLPGGGAVIVTGPQNTDGSITPQIESRVGPDNTLLMETVAQERARPITLQQPVAAQESVSLSSTTPPDAALDPAQIAARVEAVATRFPPSAASAAGQGGIVRPTGIPDIAGGRSIA